VRNQALERVVTDLLADLVGRGLRHEDGILVVADGAKALATGVQRVSVLF
jgi:hypothetical protein